MKYLLTGATGFIGGRVARLLREAGHDVVAPVRTPETTRNLSDLGIELRKGDVTDKESLRAPMKGVDGLFHIAGWYKVGLRDKSAGYRINVQGTRNVLELMKEFEIPKGVYTSTIAVFSDTQGQVVEETFRHNGPWLSEYDRTKWLAHYEVAHPMMKNGLPLVIVQPGVNYGPGDNGPVHEALFQYLQGKLSMTPRRTAYCFTHVDDSARGHILAMEKGKPGESYIIGGPIHTMIEVFELAEKITGIPAPRRHPGPGFLKVLAAFMSIAEKIFPVQENFSPEFIRSIAGVTYLGSNAKAQRELNFSPRTLAQGLRDTLIHEMKLLGMKPPN